MKLAVVVLLVLVAPIVAEAECAWVLWADVMGPCPTPCVASMSLVSTSETKAACEQALAKEVTQATMPWAKGVEVKVGETSGWQQVSSRKRLGDGSEVTFTASYICLPDTIDPREPKRGGR